MDIFVNTPDYNSHELLKIKSKITLRLLDRHSTNTREGVCRVSNIGHSKIQELWYQLQTTNPKNCILRSDKKELKSQRAKGRRAKELKGKLKGSKVASSTVCPDYVTAARSDRITWVRATCQGNRHCRNNSSVSICKASSDHLFAGPMKSDTEHKKDDWDVSEPDYRLRHSNSI